MDGIFGFIIAGFVTTLIVLLFLWVMGKLPYGAQVKAAALG